MLESLDGGKPIRESRDVDLPLAAAHFFYYAGWADKLEYAFPNRRPKPLGVAGQIIPWNFPLLMLAWKIAPALAAGNTVVLKPAETTPLTALFFADVCRQAELPPGVVNILTGDGRAGAAIVKHPDVDKIAFTGSTEVGKAIQRELAGTGTKLTLELGGKAANIIFDDAALDQAVEGIVNGIYFNQGHVCCAGSRLLVQESIYEQTIAKLKQRLETLRLGDPLDKNTDIGAINSKMQLEKITELVQSGQDEGAEIFQPACRLPEKGYWFVPTVFTNVAQSYRIAQEEIFGPVLSACSPSARPRRRSRRRTTRRTGSRRACGRRRARASSGWREQLRAGVVWANTYNRFDPASPFGGYKESGFGREGGRHGLEPYLTSRVRRRERFRMPLLLLGGSSRSCWRPPLRERDERLPVRKTYKLFVGGAFPRSESGRTYEAEGQNVARASRKDARDAVDGGSQGAQPAWAGATAYNRGQVLYRLAEMMEARTADLAAVCSGKKEVEAAIDRVVWYAGWADKLAQVIGSSNPVAGPYFNFTSPEPTGVVALLAPDEPALGGLVSRLAPALVGGNAVVVVASETHPLAAIELAEAIATSDVPGGVVNILTGYRDELAPILAGHMDVNALDLTGADGQSAELERLAADNVKRVVHGSADEQSPWAIASFLELKTVWHPIGQ